MRPTLPVYRPMFQKALKTAWFHRELWPLAAIAGLLSTGTVLNDVLAQVRNVLFTPAGSLSTSSDLVAFLNVYFSYLGTTDLSSAIASFLIFFGLALLAVLAMGTAQHVILRTIHRAATNKKRLSARALINEANHPRLGRLFIINAFFKLLSLNLLIATGFLLSTLSAEVIVSDAIFGLIFATTILGIVFAFNVISALALIAVTRDNVSTAEAIEEALVTLSTHPVVCFELSLLLFGFNLLFSFGYIAILLIGAGVLLPLFTLALTAPTIIAFSSLSIITALLVITLTIAFGGFITLFTYGVWMELAYKIMRVKHLKPSLHLHGQRLLAHFFHTT